MEQENNKEKLTFERVKIEIINFECHDIVASSDCSIADECLAPGTKITMSDGSFKNIEDIKEGDSVLVFNHELGKYVSNDIIYAYKGSKLEKPFTLKFSNGATLSIIGDHSLFEKESNRYVCIRENNAQSFVGKHFYSYNDKQYVELVSVTYESNETEYYEIYTNQTMNMIANGMLNVASDVEHILNIYNFNADLSADMEALQRDIDKYGLYLNNETTCLNQSEFDAWSTKYLYIALCKGLITYDELQNIHQRYIQQTKGLLSLNNANYTNTKQTNNQTLAQ